MICRYDYENRIVKIVKDSNDIAEYAYDALGRRIKKYDAVADKAHLYYYNTNNQVICDFDSLGVDVTYNFIYGNYIDEMLAVNFGTTYLYVHDHLYSPVAVASLFGSSIIERYEYDAYGNCTVLDADFSADADGISDFANPYYFTGRRMDVLNDGDLKIMYYRNRYYDPETGRFLTSDPLGINPSGQINNPFSPLSQYTDGMNLYEYVQSNPVMNIDVYGLEDSEDKEWLQEWEEWLEEIEWSEDYPDPWKDPKDVLCDKWTGVKKKACELFYKCLITWDRGKSIACNFAAKHCQVKCKKYYDKDLTKCNLYCQEKEAKCNL